MRRRSVRAAWLLGLAGLAALGPAAAADALLDSLEQRMAHGRADTVNAYLVANWSATVAPLNQKTASCELRAVSLSVRLARSTQARAVRAHDEALRAAAGGCARFV